VRLAILPYGKRHFCHQARRDPMAKGAGESAAKVVKDIRRKTRRRFSAEEKIRIVLEGLRGEESIATLCRREGIVTNLYYRWSKEFPVGGTSLASSR
jgi:transposase